MPTKTLAYTIITSNYMGYALALRESFEKHNPEATCWICVLDEPLAEFAGFPNLAYAPRLGISEWDSLQRRFTPFELSCAMKPFVASYFLEQYKPDLLIYLDSDIGVFDSFAHLEALQNEYAIFLTLHISELKYASPTMQYNLLRSGLLNGGFFAVTQTSQARLFLDWWKGRLVEYGYSSMENGLFVDQIWLNFAPLYFEGLHIATHTGYNVAYWNLPERTLTQKDGRIWVNDTFPLVFFHYSGYSLQKPEALSKFSDLTWEGKIVWQYVFEQYKNALLKYQYESYQALPTRFGLGLEPFVSPNASPPPKKKSYWSKLWRAIKGEAKD